MNKKNKYLKDLLKKSGRTTEWLMNKCNISYIYLNNLLNGVRDTEWRLKQIEEVLLKEINDSKAA